MTAEPFWARGDKPSLEAAAQANLAGDVAATKLHLGGTGRLPVDQEAARRGLTEEERPITERYIHAAQVLFPGAAEKGEDRIFGGLEVPNPVPSSGDDEA